MLPLHALQPSLQLRACTPSPTRDSETALHCRRQQAPRIQVDASAFCKQRSRARLELKPPMHIALHCIGSCDRSNSDPAGCSLLIDQHACGVQGLDHTWHMIDSRDGLQCNSDAMAFFLHHRIDVRHTHVCTVVTLHTQAEN